MNIEINTFKISKNDRCRHNAYDEKCLVCMYEFAVAHNKEIKEKGYDKVLEEHKAGGNFL